MIKYYEDIFKHSNSAMIFIDIKKLCIVEANEKAFALLGYDDYDTQINLHNIFCENTEPGRVVLNKDKLCYDNFYHEMHLKTQEGQTILAEVNIRILKIEETDFCLLTFRDVTFDAKLKRDIEFKQEELMNVLEEINKQNQDLKGLDKAKNKFLALVTHELRTPLSAVMATADVLKNKYYEPEDLESLVEMIFDEGKHLMEIVNDILDFSKIQTGKMEFYIEELPLSLTLKKQLHGFESMAQEKNITIKYEESNETCFYDPIRMNQITSNIISNAIKFNKPNGSLTVQAEEKDNFLIVSFKDDGPGIPEGKESKVFNEFETIESIKTHQKGTGLGMPISKKLIEAMGGKIYFKSESGIGTTFFIEIPKTKVLDPIMYRKRPDENGDLLKAI